MEHTQTVPSMASQREQIAAFIESRADRMRASPLHCDMHPATVLDAIVSDIRAGMDEPDTAFTNEG